MEEGWKVVDAAEEFAYPFQSGPGPNGRQQHTKQNHHADRTLDFSEAHKLLFLCSYVDFRRTRTKSFALCLDVMLVHSPCVVPTITRPCAKVLIDFKLLVAL